MSGRVTAARRGSPRPSSTETSDPATAVFRLPVTRSREHTSCVEPDALLLEGVLQFARGVLQVLDAALDRRLDLVGLAVDLELLVAGRLSGGLLDLALDVLEGVAGLVFGTHEVSFRRV